MVIDMKDQKNNKIEGKGTMYGNNGERVMGDYLNGKEIGKHILFKVNGKIIQNNY